MSGEPAERREGQLSRDRETIRQWAEEHDAVPVRERTGGDTDRFAIVPEDELTETQERAEWETFFDDFESGDHVVLYHGAEADEPFEVTGYDEVITRIDDDDIEDRLIAGETVTSEIRETTVIESVVVEELTVESELVGSEIVEHDMVDLELLERDCTSCSLVETGTTEATDWFDAERYLSRRRDETGLTARRNAETAAGGETITPPAPGEMTDTTETTETTETTDTTDTAEPRETGEVAETPFDVDRVPYTADLEVEERWEATIELVERFDIESEITGADVTEADTIEDHDIDVSGLHRSIVETGVFGDDVSTDEVMTHYDIDSELWDEDRIRTSFTRERTVEDEIRDRKRLDAEIVGGEFVELETTSSSEVEMTSLGESDETVAAESTASETMTDEAMTDEAMTDETMTDETTTDETMATGESTVADTDVGGPMALDDDDVGKTVVNATGEELGMVTEVRDDGSAVYVDTHPGLAERVRGVLGWGDASDDDQMLSADAIDRVTDDEVRLKGEEHLREM